VSCIIEAAAVNNAKKGKKPANFLQYTQLHGLMLQDEDVTE
jgi:hypothetical protein